MKVGPKGCKQNSRSKLSMKAKIHAMNQIRMEKQQAKKEQLYLELDSAPTSGSKGSTR